MKTWLFIAGVMFFTIAGSIIAEPMIISPKREFDFGFTPPDATIIHRFWIKSAGTDTVYIDAIKTGCSCAVTSKKQDWIAPGDSLEISIKWNLKRLRGSLFRAIRVFYNGKPDPYYLNMKGWVSLAPDSVINTKIRPYRFELAKTSKTDLDSIQFTLTNTTDTNVTVALVSPPPIECTLYLPDVIPALGESLGYIKVKPEYKDTTFESSITVLLGERKPKRVTIPIRRKFY